MKHSLSSHYKRKHEKAFPDTKNEGAPFPRVPAPLHPAINADDEPRTPSVLKIAVSTRSSRKITKLSRLHTTQHRHTIHPHYSLMSAEICSGKLAAVTSKFGPIKKRPRQRKIFPWRRIWLSKQEMVQYQRSALVQEQPSLFNCCNRLFNCEH